MPFGKVLGETVSGPLAYHPKLGLLAADTFCANRLLLVTESKCETLYDGGFGKEAMRANDVAVGPSGDILVCDPERQVIAELKPAGS